MPELITPTEYARRTARHHSTVLKAIRTGRISLIDGKIDPEVADIQWAKNTRVRAPVVLTRPVAIETTESPVNWLLENTTIWLALTRFDRSELRFMVERWIALATGTNDPRLIERLLDLLREIAECIDRVKNPDLPCEDLEL